MVTKRELKRDVEYFTAFLLSPCGEQFRLILAQGLR